MTNTNDRAVLATYLPQREVSFEFCNWKTAKLFQEFYISRIDARSQTSWSGSTVTAEGLGSQINASRFYDLAEAFNAAAQHAAQIAGGE